MAIVLIINGQSRSVDVPPEMPLLWVLRDVVGLTGTKFGCGIAACGACTVHIDGVAVRSCALPVGNVSGKITTIEGLSAKGDHPVQKAWTKLNVPQCGYCQSGQMMQAASLLKMNPKPIGRGHRGGHGGQHLPLRDLHPHPRGDQRSREGVKS